MSVQPFSIGVITDSFRIPFAQAVQAAAQMGVTGVQIGAVGGELDPMTITAAEIAEKKALLQSAGLIVSALCGDFGGGFFDPQKNPTQIEKSKRVIDLALQMGTNIVTTHIGVVPEEENETYRIMQQACNELAEYAFRNGAYFAVETGPEKAVVLKRFLDSLDTKGVAVNFDPANLVMVVDDDPVAAVHTLKDYIVHTHMKDGYLVKKTDPHRIYAQIDEGGIDSSELNQYFIETPLGEGNVDIPAYLNALYEVGYHGFLTIEREVGPTPAADIQKAVDTLRAALKNFPVEKTL